jgi:hypothetical protein
LGDEAHAARIVFEIRRVERLAALSLVEDDLVQHVDVPFGGFVSSSSSITAFHDDTEEEDEDEWSSGETRSRGAQFKTKTAADLQIFVARQRKWCLTSALSTPFKPLSCPV